MENKYCKTGQERIKNDDRYFRIIQAIPDAIFLLRAIDGVFLDINNAFEKLTGYPCEEILGRTYEQLPFFPKPGFSTQGFPVPEKNGEISEIETSLFRKDGRVARVLISSHRVEVDGEACCLNIAHEITGRRPTEEILPDSEELRQKLDAAVSPEIGKWNLELADIIDARVIQPLMDDFYNLARIPMAIVDLKGKVLVGVGWQDICIKFHRIHTETCKYCIESDLQLTSGVQPGEFRLYKCRNNMWDIATPLIVSGHHVGNIFSGQFFFDEEPLDYDLFRIQAKRYGFDEQAYISALEAVPRLSRESVNAGMSFLMKLAHMLSQLSYGNIRLARSLSERDALMESLQESEKRYRDLFDSVPVGIFRTSSEGRILDANTALVHILGYPDREALLAANAADMYLFREDRMQWQANADKEGVVHGFETRMRQPDGSIIWVRIRGRIVDDGQAIYNEGIMEDITERRKTETALRESEEKYRVLVESANDVVLIHKINEDGKPGHFLEVNEVACRRLGYSREEFSRLSPFELDDPKFRGQIPNIMESLRTRGYAVFETAHITKDGRSIPVEISTKAVNLKGEPYLISIARDITERKKAEARLRKESERGNILLSLYKESKMLADKQLYDYALDRAVSLTESAIGFFHLVSDDQQKVILTTWNTEALRNCTAAYNTHYAIDEAGNWVDCVRLKRPVVYNDFKNSPNRKGLPEGHTPVKRFMSVPVMEGDKVRIIFGVGNKVEEYDDNDIMHIQLVANELQKIINQRCIEATLKDAREELVRKEKLAVLGQLAGIVGHEIRNPLGVMSNAVYFLKTVISNPDEKVKEYLHIISQEIDNSHRIISDLLDFARTKTPQVRAVVVRELVTESLGKCLIPGNIESQTDIPDTLPKVNADPFQIGQVLQNLITNAIQAMPKGGKLRISAVSANETGFIEIRVSDTGEGISPENMEKLFQPLFTTKVRGIGLGLVVCKNQVEVNGGTITVESKHGEGTTFVVKLKTADGGRKHE
ncbi:MAG: PAS domain S-box protein [Spirochaetota bacterium]